ncbi:Holliday junction resolvase RuvX [uncultured Ruminococcus sp.]|uniref:Holliday junction resolvase RuvX n=1 Tax=uncultured Ruminococcus sp. TaxID=165186 RepID=UPI0029311DA1|nr:Holliday junction resolvase RuvX [uncultured Ruminococcus sp.]
MIALSVDLGHARTGLAVSDKNGFLASSLCVITEYNDEKLIQKIADKVKETRAEIIVVGLPRNMDGTEGESAQRAREIAEKLTQVSGVPCHMQDERGTTITAHNYLSAGNVYGKKRKQKVDAVAASIILQNYLDSQK